MKLSVNRLLINRRVVRSLLGVGTLALLLGLVCHQIGRQERLTMTRWCNLPLPTLGGAQLWTDHVFRAGFRVQQNAISGHWRLIDSRNVRRGWGSREDVRERLETLCPEESVAAPPVVTVLLHGLMRTPASMKRLHKRLIRDGQPEVIRFGYASSRQPIDVSAAALRDVLDHYPETTEFCFVGHSMGNIVVRHMIGDLQRDGDPRAMLPRLRAMVMLGPPNQGATIARRLAPTRVFGWVAGPGGMQLGPEWSDIESRLAVPEFPLAIVAGNISTPIPNPLVDGASDLIVGMDEVMLQRGPDAPPIELQTFPVAHSFLMDSDVVIDWVSEFLKPYATPAGASPSSSAAAASL